MNQIIEIHKKHKLENEVVANLDDDKNQDPLEFNKDRLDENLVSDGEQPIKAVEDEGDFENMLGVELDEKI